MSVNPRKPYRLLNRTNYYNPDGDKQYVQFSSPVSYQQRRQKIEGYENRLYWEYRYCDEHSGQTFFYTLTYNDAALPHYNDVPCFDYKDLRYLLNGGFKKMLLRKYGTNFKYFVGAELGDGKGKRGMHRNPHYHVLFFLRPADNPRYPFKEISPEEFRHLVKVYWQGFDEYETGYEDFRTAKYGIAREGEHVGKVLDFRACMYCAKYVCKDVALKKYEKALKSDLIFKFRTGIKNKEEVREGFYYDVICPRYNSPSKCHVEENHRDWLFTPHEMYQQLAPKYYADWLDTFGDIECPIGLVVPDVVKAQNLIADFQRYCDECVQVKVKEVLNEYRNRYCNKCRVSQGLGDYALEHIDDKLNPTIKVPAKKGWKNRPIGMYYYRKLYTDVVKDACGNNIRILNDLGIEYKVSRAEAQINKVADIAEASVMALTEDLYNRMQRSDVNTIIHYCYTYDRFLNDLNNNKKIFKDYGIYKIIYEDRLLKLYYDRDRDEYRFPDIDYLNDYRRFLRPSYYSVSYSPNRLDTYVEDCTEDYLPYFSHPYFLPSIRCFAVFDLLSDYLFCESDELAQSFAEEVQKVKRFHDAEKLKSFYAAFSN